VFAVQRYGYREDHDAIRATDSIGIHAIFADMPPLLKRLLVSECLVRIGEGISTSFIVLFVTQTRHFSVVDYGLLYAVQQAVSIASYLPGGRIADRTGRGPLVALTFAFFAAFPLAVRLSTTFPMLLAAFCIGGLKEFGEPARKSLIVDLAPDRQRARTVGVYYGIRNLLVVPAGIIGGLLWQRAHTLPFEASCVVGAIGTVVFVLTSRRDA
jgi:MFS family permease